MKTILDFLAAGAFIYVWWKTMIFVGDRVPMFGYVPLGVMAGLITGYLAAAIIHIIGYPFEWISERLFGK